IENAFQALVFFGPVHVFADIGNDIVGVDRTDDRPGPGSRAVAVGMFFPQPAIADGYQAVCYGNAQNYTAVRFVVKVVLTGEPYAGAQAFVGDSHPGSAVLVFAPDPAAVPWRLNSNA